MGKLSVNRLAWQLLQKMVDSHDYYGVKIAETDSGTTIVDCGIDAKGGFQAGRLATEICMGGIAQTEIVNRKYGDIELPSILVYTDHPIIATLGSQYAGWQINDEGYFAIGSGPGRSLALKPKEIYDEIGYQDNFDKAIVVLETDKYPPEKLTERIARDCKVSSQNLALVLTPTASLAGATQISGRIVETGIHKLRKLGLKSKTLLYAWGCAPIPPAHPKFAKAMARTNDAIIYGGTTSYIVKHEAEEELEKIVKNAPSMASKAYGKPFLEIFKEANYNFYKIDPNIFAPAVLIVNNIVTGTAYRCGEINSEILTQSFDMKNI